MKKVSAWFSAFVLASALVGGCADESDPKTWAKRLDDPAQRVPSIKRLDQFFTEVRLLLERALQTGMEIGLTRRCNVELASAALLGMIRGVIEHVIRTADRTEGAMAVDEVVTEMLMVALRGVLA